ASFARGAGLLGWRSRAVGGETPTYEIKSRRGGTATYEIKSRRGGTATYAIKSRRGRDPDLRDQEPSGAGPRPTALVGAAMAAMLSARRSRPWPLPQARAYIRLVLACSPRNLRGLSTRPSCQTSKCT